ncbi:methyltransferase domain-containing protein [Candidatus Bathyarchaeota archaeon]|nr:methyltransferase domain-containing protein [Candidatus Bathyarchaeota archaeon]
MKALDALEGRHFGKPVSEDLVERYWAIPQIVPRDPILRILDAGAGDGYIISKLKAKGHDVTAMEAAAINIKHLKRRGIPVVPHDMTRSPYPIKDESFDMVICADVLEHLYRPDVCLKELHRILRHDGALLLSTPNYSHPYRILQLIRGDSFHDPFEEYQFWAHVRYFTHKTLTKFIESFGFFVADVFLPLPAVVTQYARFTKGSKLREFFALHLYPKIFYRISPRFCDEPILVCRKKKSKTKVRLLSKT